VEEHVHTHTFTDENGVEHTYTHSHKHKHHHENSKAVVNRLARAVGHLEKVKKMVEDDEDCTDVLMQLAAVRSALNGTAQVILKDHIEHCIVDAVDSNDLESIDALNKAIEQFMK
jgi:DNA-binding FrmR family transcriptional regulator